MMDAEMTRLQLVDDLDLMGNMQEVFLRHTSVLWVLNTTEDGLSSTIKSFQLQ
jgi:hypothetical protein